MAMFLCCMTQARVPLVLLEQRWIHPHQCQRAKPQNAAERRDAQTNHLLKQALSHQLGWGIIWVLGYWHLHHPMGERQAPSPYIPL